MKQSVRSSVLAALVIAMLILAACGGGAAPAPTEPAQPAPTEPAQPTATPDPLAGWVAFTAPDGSFSVRLPSEPEVQSQTAPTEAGDVEITIAMVESDDHAWVVSHNGFPEAVAEVIASGDDATIQSILDGGRDGAVSNIGGTLQDEERITVDGFPGREFTFKASASGQAITGTARVILANGRMVQLLNLTTDAGADPAIVQAFFDSFQLTASP